MQIEKNYIYHIYNQGNNKQKIFFNRDNYIYFLHKIKTYITPYADILAWCLMPNHFHLMVLVNHESLFVNTEVDNTIGSATLSRAPNKQTKKISFNHSIGILTASYTRAINKQNNSTGSLFRQKTKAECINCPAGITPSFYNTKSGSVIYVNNPEHEYPQVCFNYIHQNPVKAGIVKNASDWEFSSAIDYTGLRDGKLISKVVAKEYILF